MDHPKDIGDRSTLAIMLGLQAAGHALSLPFGENTRYDLLVEIGSRIARVQCKTGRMQNGSVCFPTLSSYAHHATPRFRWRGYIGQIDYFGVWCPETGGVYLVPVDDVPPTRGATLRVEPARNGQRRRIRLAADFLVATVEVRVAERPAQLEIAEEPGETRADVDGASPRPRGSSTRAPGATAGAR
jgi:hypothetical protein